MRIAVVSPYAFDLPGGVQTQVLEIASGMRERGHDAWAVGPGTKAGLDPHVVTVGGYVRIPANRSVAPLALDPRVVRRVRRAVADADLIHVHEPFMPVTSWAALSTDTRLVVTFHADPSPWVRRLYRVASPLLAAVVRRAAVVTAVSPVAASALSSLGVVPIEIPNGIALPEPTVRERTPLRVAFLGRDETRKGLDVLLEAWPAVQAGVPGAELVVMGTNRQQLPHGVTAVGFPDVRQKWELLQSSSIFCAPNLGGESFGITLLEGMAAGCAPVASDLPAFTYLLDGTGVLTPVGDAAKLGEILVELLMDQTRVSELGRLAETRARTFSWERVLDAYEAVYGEHGPDSP